MKNIDQNKKNVKSKKIIGIFGVAILAVTLLLNSNSIIQNDFDLNNLTSLSTANANENENGDCGWWTYQESIEECNYFCDAFMNLECTIIIICSSGEPTASLTCLNMTYEPF